jgi:hypothetical protein
MPPSCVSRFCVLSGESQFSPSPLSTNVAALPAAAAALRHHHRAARRLLGFTRLAADALQRAQPLRSVRVHPFAAAAARRGEDRQEVPASHFIAFLLSCLLSHCAVLLVGGRGGGERRQRLLRFATLRVQVQQGVVVCNALQNSAPTSQKQLPPLSPFHSPSQNQALRRGGVKNQK